MIRTLVHCSDVHIRLNTGFDRLQTTIDRFKKKLEAYDSTETLIVCTGDVFHSKTSLSPEAVLFAQRLFEDLILLGFEVVCIPGYHDGNSSDPVRSDAIQTIEPYFRTDTRLKGRFHYLRTTGQYQLHNVTFGVGSIFSSVAKPPRAQTITERNVPMFRRVALFHGLVRTAVLPDQRVVDVADCDLDDFQGYHVVLLGHVHRHQFLADNCGYASSLQQQNHDEDPLEHGFIAWDLETCRGTFVRVPSDHQFVTLTVKSGVVTNEPTSLPEHCSFRVRYRDTTKEQLAELRSQYADNCQTFRWETMTDDTSEHLHVAAMGQDLLDPSRFGLLVQRCFPGRFTSDELAHLVDLHQTNQTQDNQTLTVKTWSIEQLRFSNLFCFEENNTIDFTSLPRNAVVEIFGTNGSGKTSLLDVICFALFGRCSRGLNGRAIVRRGAQKFTVALIMRSDGKRYRIERHGTKMHTSKCKIETFVYRLLDEDRTRPLSLKGQKRINQFIADLVGSYDTFCLTSTVLINGSHGFLRETNSNRKAILQTLLGMGRFADLLKAAKKQRKQVDAELRKKQISLPTLPEAADEKICRYREMIEKLTQQQTESEQAIAQFTEQHRSMTRLLETMPVMTDKTKTTVQSLENQCREFESERSDIQCSLESLGEDLLTDNDKESLESVAQTIDNVPSEIQRIRDSLESLLRNITALPEQWSRDAALTKRDKHLAYRDRVAKKISELEHLSNASSTDLNLQWNDLNRSITRHRDSIPSELKPTKDLATLAREHNHLKSTVVLQRVDLAVQRASVAAQQASAAAQRAVMTIPFMSRDALQRIDQILQQWRDRLKELRQQRGFFEKQLQDFEYDQNCQYCVRNNRHRIEQKAQLRVVVATIESLERDLAKKQRTRAQMEQCVQAYEKTEQAAVAASAAAVLRADAVSTRADETNVRINAVVQMIEQHQKYLDVEAKIKPLEERRESLRPRWEASQQSTREREMQMELFQGKIERADERLQRIEQQLAANEQNAFSEHRATELHQTMERLTIRLERAQEIKRCYDNRRERTRLTQRLARLELQIVTCKEQMLNAQAQVQDAAEVQRRRQACEKQREDASVDLDRHQGLLNRCVRRRCEAETRLNILLEAKQRYVEGQASVRDLETKIALIRSYESCLDHKQGIPNLIIGTILPVIECQVNRFLESIVDFRLEFRLVPVKQHVEILIHHRDCCYDLSAASSSEQMTCDVVTRTVLARLVNKTHVGNVFMGDEIFSQFDAERRAQIPRLFDHLRRHFDLSLVVTQMDEIRQHVDRRIQITRQPNRWSHVK